MLLPTAHAARLPIVGGDVDLWGDVLNDYLVQQHNASGGHINVTTDNLNVTNTDILARDSGRVGIATTAPVTTLDVRGSLNVTGYGNFSILQLVTGGTLLFPNNIITAAMVQTLNGTKITDVVQSMVFGGGNRTWGNLTFSNSSTVNWTWGSSLQNPAISAVFRNESLANMDTRLVSFNTSATAMNDRLVSFNTSATAMNDRMVLFNTSATNLDTRQAADNASVARTNVENTFTAGQIIQGRLSVTSFVNATDLYLRGVLSCTGDLETDAAG